MATIIDSLLVKLGLDTSEFDAKRSKVDKGLKQTGDESDKLGGRFKKSTTEGAKGFDSVTKSAATFLALIGGTVAIKRFITQQIEANAELSRLAKNLDESVSSISAWSNAAEQAGGTAEGLQGTMDMLSKSQTELMLTGQSGLIPYFSALGVSLATAEGKARPVSDVLLDLSDRFSRMDRTTANNMGRMMGIDQGTMNLLLKGRSEVELLIKRQKEYGAVTKQQAEEAARLKLLMVQSTQAFSAFGRELLSKATPAIEKIFAGLESLGTWMRENQTFVETFLGILTAGLVAVGLAAIPINFTAAAVLGLAAGIAALYDDYQTWKAGGDSLIDWNKWKPGIEAAKTGVEVLRKVITDAFYRIFAAVDAAKSAFNGDWDQAKWALGQVLSGDTGSESTAPSAPASAPSSAPSGGGKLPRGIRNNNPGNLNFAGQAGATKESGPGGRFAQFGSMREGVSALVKQLGLYVKRGKNTIRKIIETYAPSSENDTGAYIAAMSKAMGIGADDPLDMSNAQQVMSMVKAITRHETGGDYVSDADIAGGYAMARGIKGASQAAQGAGASRVAMAKGGAAPGGDRSVETNIGEVKVYTAATDANGIAKDMGKSLEYLFASQANYGIN